MQLLKTHPFQCRLLTLVILYCVWGMVVYYRTLIHPVGVNAEFMRKHGSCIPCTNTIHTEPALNVDEPSVKDTWFLIEMPYQSVERISEFTHVSFRVCTNARDAADWTDVPKYESFWTTMRALALIRWKDLKFFAYMAYTALHHENPHARASAYRLVLYWRLYWCLLHGLLVFFMIDFGADVASRYYYKYESEDEELEEPKEEKEKEPKIEMVRVRRTLVIRPRPRG